MSQELLLNAEKFSEQITALENAAVEISTEDYRDFCMQENLPTCVEYQNQQNKIIEVILLYQQLIQKDVEDLNKMKYALTRLDNDIAHLMQ